MTAGRKRENRRANFSCQSYSDVICYLRVSVVLQVGEDLVHLRGYSSPLFIELDLALLLELGSLGALRPGDAP